MKIRQENLSEKLNQLEIFLYEQENLSDKVNRYSPSYEKKTSPISKKKSRQIQSIRHYLFI